MVVDLLAVKSLLAGGGYELRLSDAAGAVRYTTAVAASITATDWAHEQIDLALQQPRVTGREIFHASATAELRRNVSCVTA